jgi:hypothetical protein
VVTEANVRSGVPVWLPGGHIPLSRLTTLLGKQVGGAFGSLLMYGGIVLLLMSAIHPKADIGLNLTERSAYDPKRMILLECPCQRVSA